MAIKFVSILPKFSLKRSSSKTKGGKELLANSEEPHSPPAPAPVASIFPSPPTEPTKKHRRTNSFTKPVTTLSNYISNTFNFRNKKPKYSFKLDSPDFTSKANLPTFAQAYDYSEEDNESFLSEQDTRDYSLPSPLFNRPMSL